MVCVVMMKVTIYRRLFWFYCSQNQFPFIPLSRSCFRFRSIFFLFLFLYSFFCLVSIFSDNILTISIDYHKNNHRHQHHSTLECQCYVIWMLNSKFQFSIDTIKRFTLTFTIIICCDFRFMWEIWFYFCLQWRLLRSEMNALWIGERNIEQQQQ